jgi:hypothetical protein
MIGRPARLGEIHALKAQFPQIQHVDEGINHANRIALVDPVIEAFRQQRRLPPIRPRNKPRHPVPRRFSSRIIAGPEVLTQPGSEVASCAAIKGAHDCPLLLYELVGELLDIRGHLEAKHPRGLQVDR